jgi:hypothetical protein
MNRKDRNLHEELLTDDILTATEKAKQKSAKLLEDEGLVAIPVKEKRIKIMTMLEDVPEDALDGILKLLQVEHPDSIREEKQETTSVTGKNVIERLTNKQIVIPPIAQKKQRVRRTPIKVVGKPLSEIIIEDRR